MIDREKVIKGLQIERECVSRDCDRNCGKCDLAQDRDWLLSVYDDALALLKEQKSEWLEDSDPGQEYGTTWACWKCMHSIHKPYIWNPYDSGYKHCPHCGAEMIMDAILTAPTVDVATDTKVPNKWISVNDRLPEMYKAVLGYAPHHNNIWAVTMRKNGEWYIWSPVSRRYDPDFEGPITHWMPLPEPPKEENND